MTDTIGLRIKLTKDFNTDPRIIAARKQYRKDLKTGMIEKDAWNKANLVYTAVRNEIFKEAV